MWRRFILLWVVFTFSVRAIAAPVPVTNMQNAMSGVIQAKAGQRGFAANDPRFGVTLQSVGSAMGGAAASAALITAAGVTAPAWITAAAGVGLAAVFAYGINLAIDGIKWIFNSDGTVSVAVPSSGSSNVDYSIPVMPKNSADAAACVTTNIMNWCDPNGPSFPGCLPPGAQNPTNFCRPGFSSVTASSFQQAMDLAGYSYTLKSSDPVVQIKSLNDAVAGLTDDQKAKPLNPEVVAAIANQAWQKAAAQPGYAGLPYVATDPITSADVQAWKDANPASWPTVGDAVAPQAAPAGGTAASPFMLPQSATPVSSVDPSAGTSTGTNPSTQPLQNLGTDPGIGAPGLEATPTAQQILSPITSVMPSLKNFVVPSHQSTCPAPSLDLYGKHLVLDGHCTLAENARPTLYAVMAFVWLALALFIILAA